MSGRKWAYSSFAIGILTSMAGNVGHTLLNPHHSLGAILFALFWPAAVFLSIETMASVNWPIGKVWSVARFGGLSLVAIVAAIASYNHISALLASYGEGPLVVALGPLSPDGLMIVATVALLANRAAQTDPEPRTDPSVRYELPPEPAAVLEAPSNGHPKRQTSNGQRGKPGPQAEAREAYLASLASGKPLSGDELGARFGYSGRWGRDRVKEARQTLPA